MAAVVYVLTVCLILIVLYDLTTCQIISRNLCLERAFAFVDDFNNCNFDNDYVQKILDDKNSSCQIKCKVNIQNPYQKNNMLWEVDISFGRAMYKYVSLCPTNNQFKKINMSIECPEWNTGQKITLPSSVQLNQVNIGYIFGALFGGLLFGVILTAAAAVIIYRRYRTHVKKRGEPKVFDNDSYAKVVEHNDPQIVQTKDKTVMKLLSFFSETTEVILKPTKPNLVKMVPVVSEKETDSNRSPEFTQQEVSPYSCLEDTSVYNLPSGKPGDEQTQDTVYNHLHEQVKPDDADYYNHTGASPGHIGDMSDYSHLQ